MFDSGTDGGWINQSIADKAGVSGAAKAMQRGVIRYDPEEGASQAGVRENRV